MIISFPQQVLAHCGRSLMLIFSTVVDGERIERRVSAEALGDHFGAASLREEDLLAAFEAHRDKIEGAARRLLRAFGRKPVLMHSGYFRFCE